MGSFGYRFGWDFLIKCNATRSYSCIIEIKQEKYKVINIIACEKSYGIIRHIGPKEHV